MLWYRGHGQREALWLWLSGNFCHLILDSIPHSTLNVQVLRYRATFKWQMRNCIQAGQDTEAARAKCWLHTAVTPPLQHSGWGTDGSTVDAVGGNSSQAGGGEKRLRLSQTCKQLFSICWMDEVTLFNSFSQHLGKKKHTLPSMPWINDSCLPLQTQIKTLHSTTVAPATQSFFSSSNTTGSFPMDLSIWNISLHPQAGCFSSFKL